MFYGEDISCSDDNFNVIVRFCLHLCCFVWSGSRLKGDSVRFLYLSFLFCLSYKIDGAVGEALGSVGCQCCTIFSSVSKVCIRGSFKILWMSC
jgi:hypothetical protein